jgi:perosamine synthetase
MKMIKLFDPHVGNDELNIINKILKSHFWASGAGTGLVKKFEDEFSNFVDSKTCIAVNSGTAALHLALSLFDIKNKEVILPALSFASTAHAIKYNGGIPKFVDISEDTLCIDPEEVKNNLNSKTGGIIPVHFGGFPANLSLLKKIAQNKIPIIEDAAHAAGTQFKKNKIGSHSSAVCFSFHPVKNLAMPTGGAITLNGKEWKKQDKRLRSLRWCGISNRQGNNYNVKEIGWNYYMNEFSAGIGLIQLKKLEKTNKRRLCIAKQYSKEIKIEKKMPYNENCSYHLFWIRVKNRNKFIKHMSKKGIEVGIHYKPIHQMSMYLQKRKLPITEKIGKEIVSIPIHPNLSEFEVTKIIKEVNKISNN